MPLPANAAELIGFRDVCITCGAVGKIGDAFLLGLVEGSQSFRTRKSRVWRGECETTSRDLRGIFTSGMSSLAFPRRVTV